MCLKDHFGEKVGKLKTGIRETSFIAHGLMGGGTGGEVSALTGRGRGEMGANRRCAEVVKSNSVDFGASVKERRAKRFHAWAVG